MAKLLLIAALLLVSCSGYDREEFRMEMGKEYPLKKWPDSAYIDTLDKFFKHELVKQSAKQKAEITMNANFDSKIEMPKNKKETKDPKEPSQGRPRVNEPKAESFPDKFFYALSRLSENPGSNEFGKKYRAKSGETLEELLVRVYGQQAKKIPKYVSESMLRQLNLGIDFSSLSEGEAVLLPNVK